MLWIYGFATVDGDEGSLTLTVAYLAGEDSSPTNLSSLFFSSRVSFLRNPTLLVDQAPYAAQLIRTYTMQYVYI